MGIAAKLDDIGKPAWIGVTILAFMVWWPLGLATLAFLIGSGRMGCGRHGRFGRWYQNGAEGVRDAASRWAGGPWRGPSSGNWAFDDYRAETLRRLEEEQREFKEFLERLRRAKDKAEFDEFMAERRRRSEGPEAQPQG